MKIQWATFGKKLTIDDDTFPYGIRFYDAPMGAGKTLSMLNDCFELLKQYPDMMIFSNINILRPDIDYYLFSNVQELLKLLDTAEKYKHLLVLLDEGLSYFAENGGIDPALMSQITQLRKNRIFIFISSQKFKRINNRIRDFSLETVQCRCFFKRYQWNLIRDDTDLVFDKETMDFIGKKKGSYIFKRSDELFNSYDTRQKIDITKNVSNLFVQRGSPAPTPAQPENTLKSKKRRLV